MVEIRTVSILRLTGCEKIGGIEATPRDGPLAGVTPAYNIDPMDSFLVRWEGYAMNEIGEKIRRICVRLLDVPLNSPEGARYCSDLKAAAAELAILEREQEKEWNKSPEGDKRQHEARQVYRSRERDSADAFAEGSKLFKPRKQDSKEKKE
jgi:hypothetical protein